MKKIITSIATVLVLLSPAALAAHPMCGKTELADVMGGMKDNMKAVKKAVKAGDIAKVNAIANDLLNAIDKSTNLVPLAISDKTELSAEQEADFKKYQKGMEFLKSAVADLASAKDAGAVKMALGKIGKASKKGHKAYKMDCDD